MTKLSAPLNVHADGLAFFKKGLARESLDEQDIQEGLHYIRRLFDNATNNIEPSAEVVDYYDRNVSSDITYPYEDFLKMTSYNRGSLLDSQGGFSSWFAHQTYSIYDYHDALSRLFRHEMRQCFKYLFDAKGDFQPWFYQAFGYEDVTKAKRLFGETAFKFACFNGFVTAYIAEYLKIQEKQDIDREFSAFLIALFAYELKHPLKALVDKILALEAIFKTKSPDTYTLYPELEAVIKHTRVLLLTNAFDSTERFATCIKAVLHVLKHPHSEEALADLVRVADDNTYVTKQNNWGLFLGAVTSFVGLALIAAGTMALCSSGIGLGIGAMAAGGYSMWRGSHLFFFS